MGCRPVRWRYKTGRAVRPYTPPPGYLLTTIQGRICHALAWAEETGTPPRRPKGIPRKRWRRAQRQYMAEKLQAGSRRRRRHRGRWSESIDRWARTLAAQLEDAKCGHPHPPLILKQAFSLEQLWWFTVWNMAPSPDHLAQLFELARALALLPELLRWIHCGYRVRTHDYLNWGAWESGAPLPPFAQQQICLELCPEDDTPF